MKTLTSIPEDTSSLEDAVVVIPAVDRALDVLPAGKVAGCRVVRMVDVVLGIYPLDQTSSYQRDHIAGEA